MLISVDAGSSLLLARPSLTTRTRQFRYSTRRRASLCVSARRAEEAAADATSSDSTTVTTSTRSSTRPEDGLHSEVKAKRVVVLGGSGRVGRSTAVALAKATKGGRDEAGGVEFPIDLVVAGRNSDKGEGVAQTLTSMAFNGSASFQACDASDVKQVQRLIEGADLVINTAGPFQRSSSCTVLEAALATQTPYIDVCDDVDFSRLARSLHSSAQQAGVPAITTTGIYPGVSNLMAAELVRLAREEAASSSDEEKRQGLEPKSLRFSYFTAGSGGAGPTILATSFLLLGEPALTFQEGKEVYLKPYSRHRVIDFGPGIGERSTYILNLPEVSSAHQVLGVPTVSARFGTSPQLWNWAMQAMAALLPQEVLSDRKAVSALVAVSDPMVRVLDGLTGEAVAMRVDLETANGRNTAALFAHKQLSVSVGTCTAAFALAMLHGWVQPGVWFPEQVEAIPQDKRDQLFKWAAQGTRKFYINKPKWMIEREPKYIGMGLYF